MKEHSLHEKQLLVLEDSQHQWGRPFVPRVWGWHPVASLCGHSSSQRISGQVLGKQAVSGAAARSPLLPEGVPGAERGNVPSFI